MRVLHSRAKRLLFLVMLSSTLGAYSPIHEAWISLLRDVPAQDIIDLGAAFKAARARGAAALKTQRLMIATLLALSCVKESIYDGRLNPTQKYPSCDHLVPMCTQLCAHYNDLIYCDKLYAARHAHAAAIPSVSRALQYAEEYIRMRVVQELVAHTQEFGSALIAGIGKVGESLAGVLRTYPSRTPTQSLIALFRRLLRISYTEFHARYGTLSSALWQTVAFNEETTYELWRIIEETRIREYDAFLEILCKECLSARSCNNAHFLECLEAWNDTPSLGAIPIP